MGEDALSRAELQSVITKALDIITELLKPANIKLVQLLAHNGLEVEQVKDVLLRE